MKPAAIASTLLLAASAVCPAVAAQSTKTLQQNVQAVLDAQCQALKAADFTAYGNTMTPDYVYSSEGQSFSRDQIVVQAKMMAPTLTFTSCTDTIDSVTQNTDDSVTAVVETKTDGTVKTPQGPEPLEAISKETLTFVPGTNGLLESRTDEVANSISVAGKVVHQTSAPAPSPSAAPAATPSP